MRNVATLIDSPRVTAREIRPLHARRVAGVSEGDRRESARSLFTAALACGLRLGEGLGLQWTDVDLDRGTLEVRRAVQRFGGSASARRPLLAERKSLLKALRETQAAVDCEKASTLQTELKRVREALKPIKTAVQVVEPKSTSSRRTIALPAVAVKALNRCRVRQLEGRLAADKRWQDSGFIFTTPIGTVLDPRNVTRAFKAILAANKLPPICVHDLRHSCATLLLVQGVSPRVVMETLGHSQVSLTLNTYSHVLPALQEDAASKMDAILSKA